MLTAPPSHDQKGLKCPTLPMIWIQTGSGRQSLKVNQNAQVGIGERAHDAGADKRE